MKNVSSAVNSALRAARGRGYDLNNQAQRAAGVTITNINTQANEQCQTNNQQNNAQANTEQNAAANTGESAQANSSFVADRSDLPLDASAPDTEQSAKPRNKILAALSSYGNSLARYQSAQDGASLDSRIPQTTPKPLQPSSSTAPPVQKRKAPPPPPMAAAQKAPPPRPPLPQAMQPAQPQAEPDTPAKLTLESLELAYLEALQRNDFNELTEDSDTDSLDEGSINLGQHFQQIALELDDLDNDGEDEFDDEFDTSEEFELYQTSITLPHINESESSTEGDYTGHVYESIDDLIEIPAPNNWQNLIGTFADERGQEWGAYQEDTRVKVEVDGKITIELEPGVIKEVAPIQETQATTGVSEGAQSAQAVQQSDIEETQQNNAEAFTQQETQVQTPEAPQTQDSQEQKPAQEPEKN